ncbi:hypothetical protein D3C73_1521790 [compost metagenome]
MRVITRAKLVCQRVHSAQAALKGGGAHAGCGEHLLARLQIGAIGDCLRQIFLDEAHAFQRDACRHRMKDRRTIGFEIVR